MPGGLGKYLLIWIRQGMKEKGKNNQIEKEILIRVKMYANSKAPNTFKIKENIFSKNFGAQHYINEAIKQLTYSSLVSIII